MTQTLRDQPASPLRTALWGAAMGVVLGLVLGLPFWCPGPHELVSVHPMIEWPYDAVTLPGRYLATWFLILTYEDLPWRSESYAWQAIPAMMIACQYLLLGAAVGYAIGWWEVLRGRWAGRRRERACMRAPDP